jgi:hypothetical protein
VNEAERLDELFRQAVAAIDAGDAVTLERLLAEHPRLVRDRLTSQASGCEGKSASRSMASSGTPIFSGS